MVLAALASRSVAIEVAPAGDWRAEAVATALRADLADDRLAVGSGAPEIVLHATVDAHALRYDARALWPGAPAPLAGVIALPADRTQVAAKLRDELHRLARTNVDARADVPIATPTLAQIAIGVGAAALLVVVPLALGWRRKLRAREAERRAAIAIALVGGALVAGALLGLGDEWLLAGGLAWGTFAAVTIPIALPPIAGFGRVEQGQLARVLVPWLAAVARRLPIVIVAYAPVAVVTWLVGHAIGLDADLVIALAIPLALLAARLAVRVAAAVAALVLDERLVDQRDRDAWDTATRGYVTGYLRRAGLPVDEALLARVVLWPGRGERLAVYGGGLVESRIVIPRRMLELALAPAGRPHDYVAPRVTTLHWTQWNAGLVVATEPGALMATSEQRQPRQTDDYGDEERVLFGEPPTLAGTMEPSDLDARATYRPEEDRIWLDWDAGEEYDGTDPGDRDFLFGAIVWALGAIARHEDREMTLWWLWRKRPPPAFAIGDVHAALGGARHHLVQFLGWRLWQREDLLTARAFQPELAAKTHDTLAHLASETAGDPSVKARLLRLGDPTRRTPFARFVLAGALLAGIALAAISIVTAMQYQAPDQETTHGKS